MTNPKTILANATWLIGAETATRTVSFVTILYLSRHLAPAGMGTVEFGLATFLALTMISAGGADVLFTHEAARRPGDVRRLAGRSLLVAWSLLAGAVASAAAAVTLFGVSVPGGILPFVAAVALVPTGMRFAFIGEERPWIVGLGSLAGQIAYLGFCLAAVHAPADVAWVPLCWLAAVSVRCGLPCLLFLREHGAVTFEPQALGADLRQIGVVGAGSVARGLLSNVDLLLLGVLVAPGALAPYALATKLPSFLSSLASLCYTALFPTLARAAAEREEERLAVIERTVVAAVLGLAVPAAVCLGFVAGPLMVRLFTTRFREAALPFALLVWRLPVGATAAYYRNVLWARSPRRDARTAVQVLVLTAALLLVVVPHAGVPGAAACMIAGDVCALALYAHAARGPASRGLPLGTLARIAAAATLAAALMLVLPRPEGIAGVAVAAGVWAVAAAISTFPFVRGMPAALNRRSPSC